MTLIILWLLLSFTGWLAVIKFFTGASHGRRGVDVTYCGAFWLGVVSLLPPITLAFNFFWVLMLKLPECPVAFKARRPK